MALISLGRASEAFAPLHEALRISPRDYYVADYYMTLGWAYWELDRFEEAVVQLRRSVAQNIRLEAAYFLLASSLKRIGKAGEAAQCLRDTLEAYPAWTAQRLKSSYPVRPEMMQRLVDDLLMLGLPER